jgi:hypothetical protein
MFNGVHDSLLVAYSVNSESEELVLSLQPHHGSASSPFKVIFSGAVAHCFDAPHLPAILYDIEAVTAEQLFTEHWQHIERGQKANGWPGPWAATLATATQFARSSNLQGFYVSSSYGLSGWVLAKLAEVVASEP